MFPHMISYFCIHSNEIALYSIVTVENTLTITVKIRKIISLIGNFILNITYINSNKWKK